MEVDRVEIVRDVRPLLTRRERDVMELVILGYNNKAICEKLCIENRWLLNMKIDIFRRLGIDKSVEYNRNLRSAYLYNRSKLLDG
jgi:DNA-binding NarL/FixJ family response regulator